jgi:hypothetical protein
MLRQGDRRDPVRICAFVDRAKAHHSVRALRRVLGVSGPALEVGGALWHL